MPSFSNLVLKAKLEINSKLAGFVTEIETTPPSLQILYVNEDIFSDAFIMENLNDSLRGPFALSIRAPSVLHSESV